MNKQYTLIHPFDGNLMLSSAGIFKSEKDLKISIESEFVDESGRMLILSECDVVEVPKKLQREATGKDMGHRSFRKNCLCIECKKYRENNE